MAIIWHDHDPQERPMRWWHVAIEVAIIGGGSYLLLVGLLLL